MCSGCLKVWKNHLISISRYELKLWISIVEPEVDSPLFTSRDRAPRVNRARVNFVRQMAVLMQVVEQYCSSSLGFRPDEVIGRRAQRRVVSACGILKKGTASRRENRLSSFIDVI